MVADLTKKVDELRAKDPNVSITQIDTTVEYTYGVYKSTRKTLIEGAVLAVIVVLLFLRDLRASDFAVALPLSMIPAFWAIDDGLFAEPRQPARRSRW